MSHLQKIEKDAEGFHSIFDQYKQQTDSKIDKLKEKNCNIERELALQQIKNHDVINQNADLLKQIEELQRENFELQRQVLNRETDGKFKKNNLGLFAIRQDLDIAMEIVNDSSKIVPTGLKIIYKMLGQIKEEIEFYGIKLVFENEDKAKNFKKRLMDFFEKEDISSFTLFIDEAFDSPTQVEYIYKLQFMNCDAYFSTFKHPEKTGELLLAELEKYVEISNVPQEFRKSWRNTKISEEEIPEELKPNQQKIR